MRCFAFPSTLALLVLLADPLLELQP